MGLERRHRRPTFCRRPASPSNNGTKATPGLSADILGDWREEVIWRESDNTALRIYVTTIPTTHRFYTLMHDRQYRVAIAWQNVAYNQPPHPGFFLGDGMSPPPVPNIVTSLDVLLGPPAPVFAAIANDTGASATDFITSDTTLEISGTAQPGTTVTLTRFGVGSIGSTTANGSGAWSFDYTGTPLPEGIVTFSATATDTTSGRTGAPSAPFAIRIDTTAPAAPVITRITAEATLVFSGTAEAGSTISRDADRKWRDRHGASRRKWCVDAAVRGTGAAARRVRVHRDGHGHRRQHERRVG